MSGYGEAYLVIVIVAFLAFVGTLFTAMLGSRGRPGDRDHRPAE